VCSSDLSWTTADEASIYVAVLDATGGVDVSATATDSTNPPSTNPSVTTTAANALAMFFSFMDGSNAPTANPGSVMSVSENCSTTSIGVAWRIQKVAGATGVCDFTGNNTGTVNGAQITVAFSDSSSGTVVPAYPQNNFATVVHALRGNAADVVAGDSFPAITDSANWFNPDGATLSNPTSCWQVDASPLTFVDMLAAATSDTDADVIPFPATEAIGDYFVIGYSAPFDCIVIDRAGCTAGSGGVCEYEYWGGSAWVALARVGDSTAGSLRQVFRNAVGDGQVIGWVRPSNWATLSLNSETADYKIRFRITTVFTTNPTLSRIYVAQSRNLMMYDSLAQSTAGTGVGLFDTSVIFTPRHQSKQLCASPLLFGTTARDLSGGIIGITINPPQGDYRAR
jgi:hypothetical protein